MLVFLRRAPLAHEPWPTFAGFFAAVFRRLRHGFAAGGACPPTPAGWSLALADWSIRRATCSYKIKHEPCMTEDFFVDRSVRFGTVARVELSLSNLNKTENVLLCARDVLVICWGCIAVMLWLGIGQWCYWWVLGVCFFSEQPNIRFREICIEILQPEKFNSRK